jgi:hypothetical protein
MICDFNVFQVRTTKMPKQINSDLGSSSKKWAISMYMTGVCLPQGNLNQAWTVSFRYQVRHCCKHKYWMAAKQHNPGRRVRFQSQSRIKLSCCWSDSAVMRCRFVGSITASWMLTQLQWPLETFMHIIVPHPTRRCTFKMCHPCGGISWSRSPAHSFALRCIWIWDRCVGGLNPQSSCSSQSLVLDAKATWQSWKQWIRLRVRPW